MLRESFLGSERGTAVVCEFATAKGPVTVISFYAKLESLRGTGYAITTMHRVLSDLTEFFEDRARRGRIIVGGDFNANPHPTWFPKGRGTPFQLDHIFVSEQIELDESAVGIVRHDELSDHAQLYVDIDEGQWG